MTERPHLTFIGLGAMGSRMARQLLGAGYPLTVTNRTLERGHALRDAGATLAESPREAAAGSAVVFAMVRDDAAARATWLDPETGAFAGMAPGSVAIECSTLTPDCVRELAAAAADRGLRFLDAPVAGSRPQADAGALHFLVGGDTETVEEARPILAPMAGGVHHLGPSGSGAIFKLIVNALFGVQIAAVGELLGFAAKSGLDREQVLAFLTKLPITSPAVAGVGARLVSGDHAPLFPIELVAKDFGYVVAAARGVNASVPTAAAVGEVYARADAEGRGSLDIAGIGSLFAPPESPAAASVSRTAVSTEVG